jgi:hypothetical protein
MVEQARGASTRCRVLENFGEEKNDGWKRARQFHVTISLIDEEDLLHLFPCHWLEACATKQCLGHGQIVVIHRRLL